MRTISKIVLHHFGGLGNNQLASTKHLTEKHLNNAHKARWPDFPSELNGSFIGYNLVIFPDGSFKQFRYVGEETAAAPGSNNSGFHICLAGNFNRFVDKPTQAQINMLSDILNAALEGTLSLWNILVLPGTKRDFALSRIVPHRVAQPNHTDCYGTSLPDDWGRTVAMARPAETIPPTTVPVSVKDLEKQLSLLQKIVKLMMLLKDKQAKWKLGTFVLGTSGGRSDEGVLTEENIKI